VIVKVVGGTVNKGGSVIAIMEESISVRVPDSSFPSKIVNLREPGFVGFYEEGQLEELECQPIIGIDG
jgi:hypothetical protein